MAGTKQYLGKSKRTGDHVWRLRVWNGERQVSRTFKVSGNEKGVKAADRALAAFALATKTANGHERDTVAQLWQEWLETSLQARLSPTTLRDYKSAMRAIVLPALGHIRLEKLTTYQIDAFYRAQEERGAAPNTVCKYHRILSGMFHQAERWGWVEKSPIRNAQAPKHGRPDIKAPTPDVVRALIAAADTDDMRLLIFLAAHLGARRGEIVGLRWEDVDTAHGFIRISRSAYETEGGGVGIKSTKTSATRLVSISEGVAAEIEKYRGDKTGYLFTKNGTDPWRPDWATKEFERIRRLVGADMVRLHDLRHTHATYLIAGGAAPLTVAKRLGHASTQTTMNVYAHALVEQDRLAAAAIGELFAGATDHLFDTNRITR